MFSQFFGHYLVSNNHITSNQFQDLMTYQEDHRAKLGIIAVAEGLLTTKQANELNRLQTQIDQRFGDIAISKGYLTEQDISTLLKLQGNPYLVFVQALEETGVMNATRADELLTEYQHSLHMSNSELYALKNSDIDSVIPIFIRDLDYYTFSLTSLMFKNIMRFGSNHFCFDSVYTTSQYSAKHICLQCTYGDTNGFLILASNNDSLLPMACGYGQWDFTKMDEDSYDAICEFINCTNGLFASKLSKEGVEIDMKPPEFHIDAKFTVCGADMIVIPTFINDKQFDIIIAKDVTPVFN